MSPSKKILYRILILEDNEFDAELAKFQLEEMDLHFEVQVVETRDDFTRSINKFQPHLILSDYQLPNFNGQEALQVVRKADPHLPFIFVTGALGEEEAVEALKSGANDFVLKDNLTRLPMVIHRALAEKRGIDERLEAENLLRQSEEKYRWLFEHSGDQILVAAREAGKIVDANQTLIQSLDKKKDELLGTSVFDIFPETEHGKIRKIFNSNSRRQTIREIKVRRKDKSTFLAEVRLHKIEFHGFQALEFIITDITERKQRERDVKAALFQGQEKERVRIAQDLHDSLGQILAGLKFHIQSIPQLPEEINARLIDIINEAIKEYRSIAHDLKPPALKESGLDVALERMCEYINKNSPFDISFENNAKYERLAEQVEIQLFRITQELVNNAIKYSEASNVNVKLSGDIDSLALSVEDDGKGFKKKNVHTGAGIGLSNILTRAEMLEGQFQIDSEPGEGTLAKITLPSQN